MNKTQIIKKIIGEKDIFGIEIGLHWLFGNGRDMRIHSYPTAFSWTNPWQFYMQDNAILTGKVGDVVIPIGEFQISGSIRKDNKGNTTYNLTYTWNDIMNPYFIYDSDVKKAVSAQAIPFANPADYNFHLSWHDKTVIRSDPGSFLQNYGWLRDYTPDWQNQLSEEDAKMLKTINDEQIGFGALAWPDQLQEIYGEYSSYYDCEVLD